MGKATGYSCDLCSNFKTTGPGDRPPDGWITVTVWVLRNGDTEQKPEPIVVCSNRCLAILGLERFEAETGKVLTRHPRRATRTKE